MNTPHSPSTDGAAKTVWTQFMDMHSGGGQKLDWPYIYIEAPQAEAELIFQHRFGRNPHRVTCTCCGEDYSVTESESLEQSSAYERGCDSAYFRPDGTEAPQKEAWKSGVGTVPGYSWRYVERARSHGTHSTLEEYLAKGRVLVIRADEIKPEERGGELQEEGYVWRD